MGDARIEYGLLECGSAGCTYFSHICSQIRYLYVSINCVIFQQLQCCGLRTPIDWVPKTPDSCCPEGTSLCTFANAYPRGCMESFKDLALKTGWLAYFLLGVAGIEVSFVVRCPIVPPFLCEIFLVIFHSCWASSLPAAWRTASATRSEGLRSKQTKEKKNKQTICTPIRADGVVVQPP